MDTNYRSTAGGSAPNQPLGEGTTSSTQRGTSGATPGAETRQQARQVAEDVEQRARAKGEELRERVMERGEEQKDNAARTADSLVEAIRAAGSTLREREEERLGRLTDELADQVQRFSGYLRDRDVGSLFDDLQDVARRNPSGFLGGSLAAGLMAGRFLRSSGSHEEQEYIGRPADRPQAGAHRPPSHQEFGSNSPTPELHQPREAAESSSPARTTTFGRETTYTGEGPTS